MRRTFSGILFLALFIAALCGLWFLLQPSRAPELEGNEVAANSRNDHGQPREPVKSAQANDANDQGGGNGEIRTLVRDPGEETRDSQPEAALVPEDSETSPKHAAEVVVRGKLTDEVTDQPISGAKILLSFQSDEKKQHLYAVTNKDGEFSHELPGRNVIPEDARLFTNPDGYEYAEGQIAHAGTNILKRKRITCVVVRLEGATCLPETTWLRWEDGGDAEQASAEFAPDTHESRILLRRLTQERTARACVNWFGSLIESEPLHIKPNHLCDVTLAIPPGASMRIRVVGSDALPMGGVRLSVVAGGKEMTATTTTDSGSVLLEGVPAPAEYDIQPVTADDGVFCVPARRVPVAATSDLVDVLFDFTGCGIADCRLTIGHEELTWFQVDSVSDDSVASYTIKQNKEYGGGIDLPRIYGLMPGRYRVTVRDWDTDQNHKAEFDVSPPPEISNWHRDFRPRSLTVRLVGAESVRELRLHLFNGKQWDTRSVTVTGADVFVIRGLSGEPLKLCVGGDGYASQIVEVDPSQVSSLDLRVVPSGTVRFKPSDKQSYSLIIEGPSPDGNSFKYIMLDEEDGTLELPPGRYTISGRGWKSAPWSPVEVLLSPGEEVEALFGPPYTTTIEMRVKDRSRLDGLKVTLTQGAIVIETNLIPFRSSKEEGYRLMFVGEGRFMLRISGDGIEDYTKDVEVERGGTLQLDVELKRTR